MDKCNFLQNTNSGKYFCRKRKLEILDPVRQCAACRHCQDCVADPINCLDCSQNFSYALVPKKSKFLAYRSACPFGYQDCINDPAYILCYSPAWYAELFGNKTPEEVVNDSEDYCHTFTKEEIEGHYCLGYDDEDK